MMMQMEMEMEMERKTKQMEDERSEVNCVFVEMQLQNPEVPTSP